MPRFIAFAIFSLALWVRPRPTGHHRSKNGCHLPTSDAEALLILSNYYPGYWWDHTDLTIAVQAHPRAIRGAARCDPRGDRPHGRTRARPHASTALITLTDVTGTQPSEQRAADIVVHYVPTAGGVVFGGYAICGGARLPEHPGAVRSATEPGSRTVIEPEYLGWVTLHEVGHALGLGRYDKPARKVPI